MDSSAGRPILEAAAASASRQGEYIGRSCPEIAVTASIASSRRQARKRLDCAKQALAPAPLLRVVGEGGGDALADRGRLGIARTTARGLEARHQIWRSVPARHDREQERALGELADLGRPGSGSAA